MSADYDEELWVDPANDNWEIAAAYSFFDATTSETGEVGLYEYRYSDGKRIDGDSEARSTSSTEASTDAS